MSSDRSWLLHALNIADKGRGQCAPNPAVGAVLVRDEKLISEGFHQGPGLPHAEVEALRGHEKEAEGATLFVSLEPCCHWGRTPPCTDLLKESKLRRVVYAVRDPNPKVSGGGQSQLRDAGIACEQMFLPEADRFYESYRFWWSQGRPYLTAKLALSLDGKIAQGEGKPLAITGEEARAFTHEQRRRSDAILTSLKTVRADDPELNVRLGGESLKKQLFVLGNGEFPAGARILSTAKTVTWISERPTGLIPPGVEVWPGDLESNLPKIQMHDLWIEAGGTLFKSLWEKGLVQRAYLYVAPKWLGEEALSAFPKGILGFPGEGSKVSWRMAGTDAICEVTRS